MYCDKWGQIKICKSHDACNQKTPFVVNDEKTALQRVSGDFQAPQVQTLLLKSAFGTWANESESKLLLFFF